MERGTYAAASSGMANLRKVEVVSNNLANVNTPGFKREVIVSDTQQFDKTLAKEFEEKDPYAKGDHDRMAGVVNVRSVTDFSLGAIQTTGNPLNVALKKENQFFAINTPAGEQYTRAGDFTLDQDGTLVTPDGMVVVGDGGPIPTTGPGISIGPDGTVVSSDGQVAGVVRVVEFNDPSVLERAGGNRFKLRPNNPQPEQVERVDIATGALEMANVSSISSIVDLITANRGFELYTKTAQSIDQLNQAAITQVGKIR